MEKDLFIDDLIEASKQKKMKKKVNSKSKGKRKELAVVKLLNERFSELLSQHPKWGEFSRTVGSGNRWGQKVVLPESAKNTFAGDLVCPDNFKFTVECKGGYNDIDLCKLFSGKLPEIDEFISQVIDDSQRCNKKPLILWKKDHKPMLAILEWNEIAEDIRPNIFGKYRDWIIVSGEDLLSLDNKFFFDSV